MCRNPHRRSCFLRRTALLSTLAALLAAGGGQTAHAQSGDEEDLSVLFERAARRVANGQTESALAIYHEIAGRDPNNPDVWFNLGELSRAVGNAEDCVRYFTRLVYLVPAERVDVGPLIEGCAAELVDGGQLTVVVTPERAEAEIAVDGLVLAEGRLEALALSAGSHTLHVEAFDYLAHDAVVEVGAGDPNVVTVALAPVLYHGTLEIVCDRPGATVTLEGEPLGATPLAGPVRIQARRPYLVRLSLDGYHDWVRRVEIEPDERHVVEATMQEIDPWEERLRPPQ